MSAGLRWHAVVQAFRNDGHARVGRLVDFDEVQWLRGVADRLVAQGHGGDGHAVLDLTGTGSDGVPGVPQVLAPHHGAPELLDADFLGRAEELGRALLGPESVTTIAMVVAKPPRSGSVVPPHQDAAYWGHERRTCGASIWIALQDVDTDNGCMQFVPGTHRGDVLPHRHLGDDPRIHALEIVDEVWDGLSTDVVACPVRAGEATIHDGHTVHLTGPNGTDQTRHALILSVRNPARDIPTPDRAAFPWELTPAMPSSDAGVP